MLKQKRCFVFYVLLLTLGESAVQQRRMLSPNPYNSFSNDINSCLFNDWEAAGVLDAGGFSCHGPTDVKLCYGKYAGTKALFAVCYNTQTLIPEFSAHVLKSGGTVGEAGMVPSDTNFKLDEFKTDETLVQASIPVAKQEDYTAVQKGFENYLSFKNQVLARGHLAPNVDFSNVNNENSFTYVLTNAAPQWQPFNSGNWAALERSLKKYVDNTLGGTLYVFTGTGGRAQNNGVDILLNYRVLTPKYYWKAVCDPVSQQSIVFVAENIPGNLDQTPDSSGCSLAYIKQGVNVQIKQQKNLGVIKCSALNDAKIAHPDFKLPTFSANCKPGVKGTFLDQYLVTEIKKTNKQQ